MCRDVGLGWGGGGGVLACGDGVMMVETNGGDLVQTYFVIGFRLTEQ